MPRPHLSRSPGLHLKLGPPRTVTPETPPFARMIFGIEKPVLGKRAFTLTPGNRERDSSRLSHSETRDGESSLFRERIKGLRKGECHGLELCWGACFDSLPISVGMLAMSMSMTRTNACCSLLRTVAAPYSLPKCFTFAVPLDTSFSPSRVLQTLGPLDAAFS